MIVASGSRLDTPGILESVTGPGFKSRFGPSFLAVDINFFTLFSVIGKISEMLNSLALQSVDV